jgi:IclR family pca regulon transcriptional regulator
VFSSERRRLTLSEVARETGLTRATARRVLLTLERLGYARSDGREFELTPKVLDIGYAYLSSLDLSQIAEADMERLAEHVQESCSAAVLDGREIVYVARMPTKRIMAISLGLGSRLPAFCTSMGRVLLADLREDQVRELLSEVALPQLTSRTITDLDELLNELAVVRSQGWALVDEELEVGLRSVAVALRNGRGTAIAALNVSSSTLRVDLQTLRGDFLPALIQTAERINARLARR